MEAASELELQIIGPKDHPKEKTPSEEFDEILQATGGFGRFQVFSSMVFVFLFMTTNHLFYSLPLLVMFPRYLAPSGEETTPAAYCLDKQNVTIDWSH